MVNSRLTDLAALTGLDVNDVFEVTDLSDTSMDPSGTSKKVTVANLAASLFALGLVQQPYAASGTAGCLAATYDRRIEGGVQTAGAATSGTLRLFLLPLPAGLPVSTLTFWSGTTAGASLTHSWAVLTDANRNVLGKSADNTAATWAANTARSFALTTPYTVPTSGAYYVGLLIAGTTIPTIEGTVGGSSLPSTGPRNTAPLAGGNSNSGLGPPSDLGATAAAITTLGQLAYCEIS